MHKPRGDVEIWLSFTCVC